MARCPDCNKFVSYDADSEPETNLDVQASADGGSITGDVRIENNCAECGTALRSATFDVEVDIADLKSENGMSLQTWLDALTPDARLAVEFELEENSSERTERTEGKGRGLRTFYGARVEFDVVVHIDADAERGLIERTERFSGEWSEDVQASSMDEEA